MTFRLWRCLSFLHATNSMFNILDPFLLFKHRHRRNVTSHHFFNCSNLLAPTGALIVSVHYRLRPIKEVQFGFAHFMSHFIRVQIFQIDFPLILSASKFFRYFSLSFYIFRGQNEQPFYTEVQCH